MQASIGGRVKVALEILALVLWWIPVVRHRARLVNRVDMLCYLVGLVIIAGLEMFA